MISDEEFIMLNDCIHRNLQRPCSETLEAAFQAFCTIRVDFYAMYPTMRVALIEVLQSTYTDSRMSKSCKSVAKQLIDKLFDCYNCILFEFHDDDTNHLNVLCEFD
jgi:hypothetical protein